MRTRRLVTATLALAVLAGAAVALAPAATAASRPIVGDLTGDGVADRLQLSQAPGTGDTVVCRYSIQAGLGDGRFAAAHTGVLPIAAAEPGGVANCPNAGVVVKGPDPSRNQLAVTNTMFTMTDGPSVQTFREFTGKSARYTGGFDGQFQPSTIASTDFDGDGWGDIWETTDQGSGFTAWVGRAATGWHQLYSTPFTDFAQPQFFDLNHAGGKDILVSWVDFGQGSGLAAVDGRTGAVQNLERGDPGDGDVFQASVVDLDHDGYLDVSVLVTPGDGSAQHVDRFVNQSRGGRWYFRPLAS